VTPSIVPCRAQFRAQRSCEIERTAPRRSGHPQLSWACVQSVDCYSIALGTSLFGGKSGPPAFVASPGIVLAHLEPYRPIFGDELPFAYVSCGVGECMEIYVVCRRVRDFFDRSETTEIRKNILKATRAFHPEHPPVLAGTISSVIARGLRLIPRSLRKGSLSI